MSNSVTPFFQRPASGVPAVVICMSGTGSNAEVLLHVAAQENATFRVAVIFADTPDCAAERLGKEFNVPVEIFDIRKFYADNGENNIKLDSERKHELRRLWSEKVWQIIRPYQVDFAIFAGFVPLNFLPDKLPCLNVHPGDLTIEKDGVRRYVGLHYKPVEMAIADGRKYLRSSVIAVQSYGGNSGKDVDAGPLLGVSAPVNVDLENESVAQLQKIYAARTVPPYKDRLRQLAEKNIDNLKRSGDHVVLPAVTAAFASGKYGSDNKGNLYFLDDSGKWKLVKTVEFSADGNVKIMKVPGALKRSRGFLARYCKYLYTKIVRGEGSPDYIARGWALGMFVGCVVPVFCQLIIAIPLSFVIRGSKIGAALGTFITTPVTAPFIYPVVIWVGNKVVGGNLSAEASHNLLKIFNDPGLSFGEKWGAFADLGAELAAAFFAGGLLWALIMTPLTYFGARYLVVRYRKIRENMRKKLRETA